MTLNPTHYAKVVLPESLRPTLAIVVDTEEEFDWSAPFSRQARATRNLRELPRLQEICQRHGAVPLYVVDHPVASDTGAMRWLCSVKEQGACEIGAHLHPWVTPPHDEVVNNANSFTCNLPAGLQLAKIESLSDLIAEQTGERPTAFRAGRYGIGAATLEALVAAGYRTDLSVAPHSSFVNQHGPSFYHWHNGPFWVDAEQRLLSLPVTTGFSGVLRSMGPVMAPVLDRHIARRMRLPGILAHMRMLERARLTPEGTMLRELKRLVKALVHDGERVLTLSLHSSTLLPGATVYARDAKDRDALLARIDALLGWFVRHLGGVLAPISEIDKTIRGAVHPIHLPSFKPDRLRSEETA